MLILYMIVLLCDLHIICFLGVTFFFPDSGLQVGWWAGSAKDINDPHGLIIRITAEHGRYVARSYSPRYVFFLARLKGVPLDAIFFDDAFWRWYAIFLI